MKSHIADVIRVVHNSQMVILRKPINVITMLWFKVHIHVNTRERPHPHNCDILDALWSINNLKMHVRIHTREKPFKFYVWCQIHHRNHKMVFVFASYSCTGVGLHCFELKSLLFRDILFLSMNILLLEYTCSLLFTWIKHVSSLRFVQFPRLCRLIINTICNELVVKSCQWCVDQTWGQIHFFLKIFRYFLKVFVIVFHVQELKVFVFKYFLKVSGIWFWLFQIHCQY